MVLCYKDDVPLRIVGLKPSTKYLLRVRAVNEVGAGPPVVRNQLTENIRTSPAVRLYTDSLHCVGFHCLPARVINSLIDLIGCVSEQLSISAGIQC